MVWELWGFWRDEGLDRGQGTGVSKSKGKGPGLKPILAGALFVGLKPHAPSGKTETPPMRGEAAHEWGTQDEFVGGPPQPFGVV
jgi:hypothetical protein